MASMDELDALARVLDEVLTAEPEPRDDEDDVTRMMDLEYAVSQLIRGHDRIAFVRAAGRGRVPLNIRGDLGIGDFVKFSLPETNEMAIGRINTFKKSPGGADAILFPMYRQVGDEWETIPYELRYEMDVRLPLDALEKISFREWRPRLDESEQRYRNRLREPKLDAVTASYRTAGMDDLADFLSDKAWEEVEQFVDNLEYRYDPDRLRRYVEYELQHNPALVETLRQYGVTPKLLLANLDEFYRYLQDNWADQHGYADVDYEPINKFVAEFESEWFNTVDDIVSNKMQISIERGQEILDTLMADGHVLSAFLCDERWSCDWVDDILAVFGDDGITQDDLGFSGYSNAGSNAASEASWPAIQQVLARMLEEYLEEYLEEDAGKFRDPRQTNLPVR
jgi:hypothetical protein